MSWDNLFLHMDGLVHVIGRHLTKFDARTDRLTQLITVEMRLGVPDHARFVFAECDVEIAGINTDLETMPVYLRPNTKAKFPTCIECWDRSNFGTYRPR